MKFSYSLLWRHKSTECNYSTDAPTLALDAHYSISDLTYVCCFVQNSCSFCRCYKYYVRQAKKAVQVFSEARCVQSPCTSRKEGRPPVVIA